MVYATIGKELPFLVGVGKQLYTVIFGEENGSRMRSESEHDRFSANLKGKVFHAIQKGLMTQVNAVERAYG